MCVREHTEVSNTLQHIYISLFGREYCSGCVVSQPKCFCYREGSWLLKKFRMEQFRKLSYSYLVGDEEEMDYPNGSIG